MKLKTCKSALKRIKIKKHTLYYKKAFKKHLLIHKTSKRLRNLSRICKIHKSDQYTYFKLLPYII
jgi:large subunit ribosomal protein L35